MFSACSGSWLPLGRQSYLLNLLLSLHHYYDNQEVNINLYFFIFTTHMVLLLHILSSSLFPKNIQLGIFVLIALGGEA